MNFALITGFLNTGLPDATGGVMSAIAIDLFKKAKGFFKSKRITQEEVETLIKENSEFANVLKQLNTELKKKNKSFNFYGSIKKQIIIEENEGGDITITM